nr:family 20 glycosylhydrolase [Bacteroides sp. 519]
MGCFTACENNSPAVKSYNEGINIIPMPQTLIQQEGRFKLVSGVTFDANTPDAKAVAAYFISKMERSTGYKFAIADEGKISLTIDPSLELKDEGYHLTVTPTAVNVVAKTSQGLFYGMQSFMQLLPAEIESQEIVPTMDWTAQAVNITDEPRFTHRGILIDPCRHFISVADIKKQLDVLALFKINRMHWHLTDDQGWRIEIKKYPRLTEVGSWRIDGEGTEYGGFYTQEEIKEVVNYAAERFITIIPELEIPGHELAAISAYPELSCTGRAITPRIIWGVEDIVLCAGKEETFRFLEDVVDELVALFPGTYFHIGGDESPKTSWEACSLCQKRIREEGLKGDKEHTAEEKLQSYVVQRMEKYLAKYGRKIIGWDEILEGGLAPTATVMSWRGEKGGIAAAMAGHDAIMTPGPNGFYLDYYQGDSKIEPVAIGGYSPLKKTYSYNPVPDTLVSIQKDHHIIGVQANVWSEYLYTTNIREYHTFPGALALAEVAWTTPSRKDYNDFERRIHNAYKRMDGHTIHYHIPLPEQPHGSCNYVAFTDSALLEFTTSRPEVMVYTTDGTDPVAQSTVYKTPIVFTQSGVLKIATLLPTGKLSSIRTIQVEKQNLAPALNVENLSPGLNMQIIEGMYLHVDELEKAGKSPVANRIIKETKEMVTYVKSTESMRGVKQYASIATGYVDVAEDGVYYISSNLEEVWIDGKLMVNNRGEVKRYSRKDTSVALAKGLHEIKAVFLGHIIGGWPSNWNNGSISLRKSDNEKFEAITANMLWH